MGMTLAEKILARASGRAAVVPDEIVVARVDVAMSHENADLVRKSFAEIGVAQVWDPEKIVIISRSPRAGGIGEDRHDAQSESGSS